MGYLLALRVTPTTEQDCSQVKALAESMQEATGESVELPYVAQGYTGEEPAEKRWRSARDPTVDFFCF